MMLGADQSGLERLKVDQDIGECWDELLRVEVNWNAGDRIRRFWDCLILCRSTTVPSDSSTIWILRVSEACGARPDKRSSYLAKVYQIYL